MKFKQCSFIRDIIEGLANSKQQMIEEGLWNDAVTFEEWSDFAGSHIEIVEIPKSIV